jgi:hypothetical protein
MNLSEPGWKTSLGREFYAALGRQKEMMEEAELN